MMLGGTLRAGAGGFARRVGELGQHPDAALLDLEGLGVLGVVDEVAVEEVISARMPSGRPIGGAVRR
jgi:hypothetical protein